MWKKIVNKCKYWGQLFLLPIYWLSFLMPRNKKIWLFGSTFGRRFADNPRYLFQYVSQHKEELQIRPIWISHNKSIVTFLCENGYEAYYYHSLRGIWMALRGKVYLFDNYSKDINFWQSGGAVKVNLWHGVGNKRINYDNEHDKVRHPKNVWEKFKYFPRRLSDEKPSHYILATSMLMKEIFARAFQVPQEHVIVEGYPRNDVLFDTCDIQPLYTEAEKNLLEYIEQCKNEGKTILGYMPTFRESENRFLEVMDLQLFNQYLTNNNLILVCKLHPKSVVKKEFDGFHFSNIYNVDAEVDGNCFLGKIDLLISDYSSVYSDFTLLGKPVVAFWYDFDLYLRDTRGTYFEFEEYMPEKQAVDMESLEKAILEVLENDESKQKREKVRDMMYRQSDNQSCKRLVETLKNAVL